MNKTVFVAGKISGLPNDMVKEKFHRAEHDLLAMGYHVINPPSVYDPNRSWEELMRENIQHMLQCDEVHMLPCWQDSKSALLERDIALRLGMNVVYH